MIINDEQRQVKVAFWKQRENNAETSFAQIKSEIRDAGHIDKTNAQAQLGRMMLTQDFEQKLFSLNKNLTAETFPKDPSKRALYITDQRGKFHLLSYEAVWMPERSVMTYTVKRVPDPKMTRLSAKERPSDDPDALQPGWIEVPVPGREAVRGWRTVLARLVQDKIISAAQVARVFGDDDTPEWRTHVHGAAFARPW